MTQRKHNHYYKDVSDLQEIDVYKVCDLFGIQDSSGAIHHAIKKLLVAGGRGAKDYLKDLKEARDTLERKIEMVQGGTDHVERKDLGNDLVALMEEVSTMEMDSIIRLTILQQLRIIHKNHV